MELKVEALYDASALGDFICGIPAMGGCQFITVEAYCTKEYSAVGFYRNCGFSQADIVAKYDTLRMYRNLLE